MLSLLFAEKSHMHKHYSRSNASRTMEAISAFPDKTATGKL